MKRLVSKLPPLKSLVAFEAVMRLGTMTAAAMELTSTQPAVSQHIKVLEKNLGVVLFNKSGRLLKPTRDALRYYNQIQTAFNEIADSSEQLRNLKPENQVNIVCHSGLANFWLLPLFSKIQAKHSDITINITLSDSDNLQHSNALYLRFGVLDSDAHNLTLFTEKVGAVCSKNFAQIHQLSSTSSLVDISRLPLIHMDELDSRWLNWHDWFTLAGGNAPEESHKIFLGNYYTVISAVKADQGIALGWLDMMTKLFNNNELVQVSDTVINRSNHGYYIDTRHVNNEASRVMADYLYQLAMQEAD
ncbi:MAG: LysR family transcriptional regulator [Amphritea sp.]